MLTPTFFEDFLMRLDVIFRSLAYTLGYTEWNNPRYIFRADISVRKAMSAAALRRGPQSEDEKCGIRAKFREQV